MPSLEGSRIYLAGHAGLVGAALHRRLSKIRGLQLTVAPRRELDLTQYAAVEKFIRARKPDIVVNAAGLVGGIGINAALPAEFIYQNLMIQAHLVHAAWKNGVRGLLNFGSGCMYPVACPQPMKPDVLLTGKLEPTSRSYAIAKLAGMEMCVAYNRQYGTRYINAIPANVYGPGDRFETDRAHVISALIRKFHDARKKSAREVVLWGTGKARRQFIFVDDLAEACLILLEKYEGNDPVNIGSDQVCAVAKLAVLAAKVVGFRGRIAWDTSKPDGPKEKTLDSQVILDLGWRPRTDLQTGLKQTYRWYLSKTQP